MSAFFYIYETVDFPIIVTAEETTGILDGYKEVIVSFGQNGNEILTKDSSMSDVSIDTETDTINVHLSQEDTSKFKVSKTDDVTTADVQVNILYEDKERDASASTEIEVRNNLHKKVMGDGE